MSKLFDSIVSLISPEMIGKAASFLGENPENVSSATKGITSSILGNLMHNSDNSQLEKGLLESASDNSSIMGSLGDIFSGNISGAAKNIGAGFLGNLFGDKLGSFSNLIASENGISEKSSNSLLGMIAPVLSSFLGNTMKTDGIGLSGLASMINSEKDGLLSFIPSGLTKLLGIGSLSALGSKLFGGAKDAASNVVSGAGNVVTGATGLAGDAIKGAGHLAGNVVEGTADFAGDTVKKTGSMIKWLMPLLFALGAILLLMYLMRSCKKDESNNEALPITETVEDTTTTAAVATPAVRESVKVKLPSGKELDAYKGGIEEQVIAFLSSGELAKMTPEQLKAKWFNFDNINYKFGSTTELEPGSETQVNNVVAILKEFKDANIKLGAYTDKKGDDAGNLKTSQGRASNMKSRLDKAGVGAQVKGADGYGEQFATVAESGTDDERAVDRKIALRFTTDK